MVGCLELHRRQRAQRRVDTLVLVDLIQEAPDLRVGIGEVPLLSQRHLLVFTGPQQPFSVAILAWLALLGHADRDPALLHLRDVGRRGVLHALVAVVDAGHLPGRHRPLHC